MERRKFLAALAGGCAAPLWSQSRRPNVVIFLTDDMGYADIGSFGATEIKTPHTDRLAREGIKFTHCYSNGPVCTPTRAALMTGRYQQRVGLEWAITPKDKGIGLPVRETTIAAMLKGAGYRTALFGKWHLGWEREFGPNAHGFEEFFGLLGGNHDFYSHRNIEGTLDLWENTVAVERSGYTTDLIPDALYLHTAPARAHFHRSL